MSTNPHMDAHPYVRDAIRTLSIHRADYLALPLLDQLIAYRHEGRPLGGFLTALLSNDLTEACGRADETNLWLLPIYVSFLYNEMPGASWGSAERIIAWQRRAQRGDL